jgi:cation-transporting ATPase E
LSNRNSVQLQGLSESEVIARRARGEGNNVRLQTSRSYVQILRQNAFTFINSVLFAIGITLVLMGRVGDAVMTAGLVLLNVVVGVVQEGRAKHTLDQIALLIRPKASVVRDGKEHIVDPSEIVRGDLLIVRPGDQIVVDGQVLGSGCVDLDESLLTGESDLVPKSAGDNVLSGSFWVTGIAFYEAQKVGADSYANQLTTGARAFRQVKTPLQRSVDLVIRVLMFVVGSLGILMVLSLVLHGVPTVESVRVAAVIATLVPQGLFAMVIIAYALGAVRIAGKGALVQQSNAVESLSNVTVLCLDKTGTLTTNRIELNEIKPLEMTDKDLEYSLGAFVASVSERNRTAEAIAKACGGNELVVAEEVPFSSERKWSALAMDDRNLRGVYVLGAPEILRPNLKREADLGSKVEEWTATGQRVLLFAHRSEIVPLFDEAGEAQLPRDLSPLGLLSFSDELRDDAQTTLQGLANAGVELKVISGDNPQTVAAVARKAGLRTGAGVVSGLDLDEIEDAQLIQISKETNVFGRITPGQKERLVRVLKENGEYVAMIGDGVNDVLSLKQAHLGIAMQSGSQATRGVADIVLLNDSFSVLPTAFSEGQRIVNGMQDIVRLFLTRTFYVTLLILGVAIVGVAFPITPKHNAVLALLTVGIPTLALALWARPEKPPPNLLRSVSHFVFPAAFTVAVLALLVYLVYLQTMDDVAVARSALTTCTVFCGLLLISFVEPPTPAWVGGDKLSGDWRPTILALAMLLLYVVITLVPALREFFELTLLRTIDYLFIGLSVAVWAVALRLVWRRRLFEWWLGIEDRGIVRIGGDVI